MPRRDFASHASARRLEDVFLTRYEWLRKRALAFVSGDRARADDLVHDLFVELRLGGVDPDEIRDPEAYLARTLRNLHISSIRRAARAPTRALSVVDYDSLDALLSDTRDDPARAFEDSEDIRRVCLYACQRKETSKAASALILRFFYGYTPQATATLMRVSAGGVDQWLSIARAEARAFVREPRKVGSVDGDASLTGDEWSEPSAEQDVLVSLRRRILTTRQGACLSEVELARWDVSGSESVDRERLAHVVSCRACLESVAARVGLPSPWEVASRGDDDAGPTSMWGSGGRRRTGAPKITRSRPDAAEIARLRAVLAYQPQSLHILVNGFVVGSQTVGGETTTQRVQVGIGEPMAFVEVLADDRVRLLMMAIDAPPAGEIEQRMHRRFADGRALTVTVSFAVAAPQVSVTYEPATEAQSLADSSTHAMLVTRPAVTSSVPQRLRNWLLGGDRSAIRPWWSHGLVKACGVIFVCWLLFGGGAEALASTTSRVVDIVRTWIVALLPAARREPARISATPIVALSAAAATVVPVSPVRPVLPRDATGVLDVSARARVELEVLRVLQPVHAYLGQEIGFRTARDGKVVVEGVLVDAGRQQALVAALAVMTAQERRHVALDLLTADEATGRERAAAARQGSESAAPSLRSYAVTASRFPAFDRVRAALERGALTGEPSSTLEQQAQRFASRVLALSRDASQHSAALRNIGVRMPHDVVATLSADDREAFAGVVGWHARRLEQSLLALGSELLRVYGNASASWPPLPVADAARAPIWALIDRAAELDTVRAYAVMRGFSAAVVDDGEVGIVDTCDFWALVEECVHVARLLRP